ncbi:hypothetical protein [Mumia zhuanghuii]|uniref:Uncharacterized protein n=1 Tax=Mumia zhuanghuii TaxID=2585211 RepID=A0A5C4M1P6_9ACTN|nr:hypothetical protein [Mumia zhuanghuii]TNC26837.1 hypothetical protein FHE65_34415 [Mumia zhuanghuii]
MDDGKLYRQFLRLHRRHYTRIGLDLMWMLTSSSGEEVVCDAVATPKLPMQKRLSARVVSCDLR